MVQNFKHFLDKILLPLGLKIEKVKKGKEVIDLRGLTDNPVEACYMAQGRKFIMDIPIEKCRSIGFSCANPQNPFVKSLLLYVNRESLAYQGSPLQDYYSTYQPGKDVEQYYDGKKISPPWDNGYKAKINTAEARLERKDFLKIMDSLGLKGELYGQIKGGPVSDIFGQVTLERLIRILNSIRKEGYQPEKVGAQHISGRCFVYKKDFRVNISSGKHRMTALQALGFDTVPILLNPVLVYREHVKHWPNVIKGYYTKEEALAMFDERFALEHPSGWSDTPLVGEKELISMRS
jgi:hypothetical protein